MKTSIKNTLMAVIFSSSALFLQGCTDEDLALGTGVIIGVIISDGHHHHHRDHDRPPRYRRHGGFETESALSEKLTATEQVVENYGVSEAAAEKILYALNQAQSGNFAELSEIGLQKADLIALVKGQNLSEETLNQVSLMLETDIASATRLIKEIKTDVKSAQQNKTAPSIIPGH